MRSRWFHRPEFHTGDSGVQKRTGWLELFYDLVFVAAFIQLGNGLGASFTTESLAIYMTVFSSLWFSWTGYTFFNNRYDVDDLIHRVMVFVQMTTVVGMAIFAPRVLQHDPLIFSLFYSAAQLIVASLYARAWKQSKAGREFSVYWGILFLTGGLLWLVAAFIPAPYDYILWFVSAVLYIAGAFTPRSRAVLTENPLDLEHLAERYGILTLIVLGEAFVKVMSGVTDNDGQIALFRGSVFTLLIIFTIWWIYFDDIAESKLREKKFSFTFWLYGHLPLHGAIVAIGAAIPVASRLDLDGMAPHYRMFLCWALALAFAAVAMIDWATARDQSDLSDDMRTKIRLASAALMVVIGISSRFLDPTILVAVIVFVCITQVVFDMLMAPMESVENVPSQPISTLKSTTTPAPSQRPTARSAVRKGTPNELRNDAFSFMLRSSWTSFMLITSSLYLLANVLFAGVYMAIPDSIHGARANSFADDFYFSIQTMATIGYGVLYPTNDFANIVVVLEAVFGLAATALITGMIVSKAARPRAGVMFSRTAIVDKRDGKPCLMFRVGNTRGAEIFSAQITVSALRDEVSLEGDTLRRISDLKLHRHRSPFFALTWVVIHEIDEASPLATFFNEGQDPAFISLNCVLTGQESVYGQTVHARHSYYPDEILVGKKFVDVISELPDGRLMVDYSKFNDVR